MYEILKLKRKKKDTKNTHLTALAPESIATPGASLHLRVFIITGLSELNMTSTISTFVRERTCPLMA